MTLPGAKSGVRLAELLATLSLATDLGMGQPMEHMLRQCLIALRLAERLGLSAADRVVVYYASLVAWVGCHVDAYEQAKWFGDDTALKTDFRHADFASAAAERLFMMRHLGAGRPAAERARLALTFLGDGRHAAESMLTNHWLAADGLAARLGLGQRVRDCVEQTFERWDGRGAPRGMRGEEILLTSRLVCLADVTAVYHRAAGTAAAVDVARERSGTQFDPAVVDLFATDAAVVLDGLDDGATWQAVIDAEPGAGIRLSEADFDSALEAIADFTDVKSPYTIGHSRGVADLAGEAARIAGLDPEAAARLRRAGLVHDLGRLGVPNTIWDKKGTLSHAEAERVRMHPYLTERTLAASPALAPLAAIAVLHHERLDGSGYPRGVAGPGLPVEGRLLAAADFYLAKTEPRPYRPAADAAGAAAAVRAEVRAGRLDGDAASAVLKAAGHPVARRAARPAGLTSREVEVLRLLAMGLSNREIADRLVISPKTASHHVEHIYAKTGAANRALASLFAATHGLIGGLPEAELRLKNRPVPGAEQPHPADPAVRGRVVVGLLLDHVVAVPGAHPQPVGDVPAPGYLAGRERAQLVDPGRGEPAAEDDLHGHLGRRPRQEVLAGGERLKVNWVRQHGAQGRHVLGRDRPGERLARGFHRLPPAVSS